MTETVFITPEESWKIFEENCQAKMGISAFEFMNLNVRARSITSVHVQLVSLWPDFDPPIDWIERDVVKYEGSPFICNEMADYYKISWGKMKRILDRLIKEGKMYTRQEIPARGGWRFYHPKKNWL